MTSESSRAGVARASWSACPRCWKIFTVAKPVGSQTNASIAQDRRAGARHCRRWLRLTLGDPSRGAAGRRDERLECALLPGRALSTAALVDAPLRSVCRASPCCGKPYRAAPPMRPTPSPPSSHGVPGDNDVDMVQPPHTRHIRHPKSPGTQRARAARSGVTGACAFTSGGTPGDHPPERNQVHTVSLP